MKPDLDSSNRPPTTTDDEQMGALVRAIADEWRLPPQRLAPPTWRARVDGRPAPRRRGWSARLFVPATAAIVATMIVAFVAVWLTAPRTDRAIAGSSPSVSGITPGASTSATASATPTASALPALVLYGDLPDPSKLMVRSDDAYRIVDLATGTLGAVSIGSRSGPTTVLARPGGGWVCICSAWSGTRGGRPSGLELTLEALDAKGTPESTVTIRRLSGRADPAWSDSVQLELVDARAVGSADGRYAFVGWSERQGAAGWRAGVDVIDLAEATVVNSVTIPLVAPAIEGGRPSTRLAPRVTIAPSGEAVLISSFWYAEDPSPTPPSGTEFWTAAVDGNTIGALVPAGTTAGERCAEFDSGLIDATRYFVLCTTPDGRQMVERNRLDGRPIDQTEVPRIDGDLDRGPLVTRRGGILFIWDPIVARLTRVDLDSGVIDSATATAAVRSTTPLDALASLGGQLGRWMAPPALAKVLLEPAVVVSADGTRVYAIGIDRATANGAGGSSGIFAFDARSLAQVGHWAPMADFSSLAMSADGRFVYAAGLAGVDAGGHSSPNEASITVYDSTDGAVRLIAGHLGRDGARFLQPIVR